MVLKDSFCSINGLGLVKACSPGKRHTVGYVVPLFFVAAWKFIHTFPKFYEYTRARSATCRPNRIWMASVHNCARDNKWASHIHPHTPTKIINAQPQQKKPAPFRCSVTPSNPPKCVCVCSFSVLLNINIPTILSWRWKKDQTRLSLSPPTKMDGWISPMEPGPLCTQWLYI